MAFPSRTSTRSANAGFTLIELMIVVAIIGILAAIAIPNFMKFQLRAKVGEGKVNLAAIRSAQEAYYAEVGFYVPFSSAPQSAGTPPGQNKVGWNYSVCTIPPGSDDPGFCAIGWQPEGGVYFNYGVDTNTGVPLTSSMFFAAAESDIDGEGTVCILGLNRGDDNGSFMGAGPMSCGGVVNPTSGDPMFSQVGPCDTVAMGLTIF